MTNGVYKPHGSRPKFVAGFLVKGTCVAWCHFMIHNMCAHGTIMVPPYFCNLGHVGQKANALETQQGPKRQEPEPRSPRDPIWCDLVVSEVPGEAVDWKQQGEIEIKPREVLRLRFDGFLYSREAGGNCKLFSGVTGWGCFRRYRGCVFSRLPGERVSRLPVVVFFAVTGGPQT